METPRTVVACGGAESPALATQQGSSVHTLSAAKEPPDGQSSSQQSYDSIISSGNSRLHAGNNYYNNYYHLDSSAPQLEATRDEHKRLLQTFIRCLNFKEASSRHAGIARAHPDTCRWVVDCPQYTRWRDPDAMIEHHGCLWIKGKPGAGKSTIIKGLLRHVKEAYPNDKVVSFFFNARGTSLERSTEGLYRSILHQMAGNVPSLLEDLDQETMEFYAEQGWPLEFLKDLSCEVVRHLTEETGITIFIDALDEGDVEDDVRDMVAFIEELTASTSSSTRNLYVCLASRHYPAISMHNVEKLTLDSVKDHDDDIVTYVQAQLRIGNAAMRAELVLSICTKASGVFLWVVLVVKILNKEADRGNQHKIPARLQEIPDGLHDLLETIIERDADNNECLLPALIWVLFSERTLQPIELYFAIMISTGQLSPESMVWNPNLVDQTVVESFLISSSKGLVECVQAGYTASWSMSRRVQIIHESVREYLFADRLHKLDKDLKVDSEAKCHWWLAKWCLSYIQLAVEHGLLGETEQARSYTQCPLLEYATEFALTHAETAARLGHRQIVHDTAPIETWQRIGKAVQNETMLHLLVSKGWDHLLAIELGRNAQQAAQDRQMYVDARSGSGQECTALELATRDGNINAVGALLKNGAGANVECEFHGSPLKIALAEYRHTGHYEYELHEYEPAGRPSPVTIPSPINERGQIVELLLAYGANKTRLIRGKNKHTDDGSSSEDDS